MKKKAIIFGISGLELTTQEISFLKKVRPWGIILFSRNIKNLFQLGLLIKSIKILLKDKNYPIMIDQEGGRVSRLNNIMDFSSFPQEHFGKIFKKDRNLLLKKYQIYIDSVCNIFKIAGINIVTAPVLDIKKNNSHPIIGDRSFSNDPNIVVKMGNLCIKLFKKYKIGTVIKHIPGHGSAKTDSHYFTPSIYDSKKNLNLNDFRPFKRCLSPFAMTAHAIYKSYDPDNVCTQSKIIIKDVIRKKINFKGLLISDDISMKALKFGLKENAIKALDAGCNLILHCNGNMKEMNKLAKVVPKVSKFTQKKTEQFNKFLG
tara:strand:- start:3017 stop:3964 length:948 start_codon:yes stop_codon:yes gene_type:complete